MAYRAYDVTRLPHGVLDLGVADTLDGAAKLAAAHLTSVFGARPYQVFSERDHAEDGLDILAYAGLESVQIAVNKVI